MFKWIFQNGAPLSSLLSMGQILNKLTCKQNKNSPFKDNRDKNVSPKGTFLTQLFLGTNLRVNEEAFVGDHVKGKTEITTKPVTNLCLICLFFNGIRKPMGSDF